MKLRTEDTCKHKPLTDELVKTLKETGKMWTKSFPVLVFMLSFSPLEPDVRVTKFKQEIEISRSKYRT